MTIAAVCRPPPTKPDNGVWLEYVLNTGAGVTLSITWSSKTTNAKASVLTHSFASRFGENFFGSAVLDENGFVSGGPCERFRILVSMLNPFVDCGFEFRDVVENTSPYTLSGDFSEEPLDEVEPGAGRRREVQDKAFVSCQPALHGRCLVGGVVVED